MNISSTALLPLLALGAVLPGCSCGTYHPDAGKSADLTSTSPAGTFTGTATGSPQVKCDANRNCTFTFKDGGDAGVTWSVEFTLDSAEKATSYPSRDL